MIHPLIIYLSRNRTYNEWLFLLVTYELGRTNWVKRADVVQAAQLNGNTIKALITRLINKGDLRQRQVSESRAGGSTYMEVCLTQQTLTDLQVAFNLARTAASQPVAA